VFDRIVARGALVMRVEHIVQSLCCLSLRERVLSDAALAPSLAGASGNATTTAPNDLFNIELTIDWLLAINRTPDSQKR
jgi:hypothetical protein